MGDGTVSCTAGVRLKKTRGSRFRCVITGRTDGHFFYLWPSETSREPRVLLEELFCLVARHVLFGSVKPLGEPRVLLEEYLFNYVLHCLLFCLVARHGD